MNLNELKEQAGLSNKQWDKSIKGLKKGGLVKVSKINDNLIIDGDETSEITGNDGSFENLLYTGRFCVSYKMVIHLR